VTGQSYFNKKIKFGEGLTILSYVALSFLTPIQNLKITKCSTNTLFITLQEGGIHLPLTYTAARSALFCHFKQAEWQFRTDLSEQPIGPIFKGEGSSSQTA
jgi:hypothetical protein